ncbi:MAG: putative purine catabolism-related protein [Phycisphaerales bacterium]|nr:putative purine catabolism-related protein [Phycisphaerales bacterium]
MPGALTAIVHDTLLGRPAGGLRLQVYWVEPSGDVLLRAASTNADGSTVAPLVTGPKLSAGIYKLVLHAGDYLAATHADKPRCLDILPIVFVIDDAAAGRHVKILLGPDSYVVHCT